VVRVLPNGHLMIAGEKQIGVNANVDVLRFPARSTRVPSSPATVASAQIANVRVEQRGRGAAWPMRRELAGCFFASF
jgi:flagellar L-ring protein precursor FlgH